MKRCPAALVAALVAALLAAPALLGAQLPQPEVRADLIHSTASVWHLGAGLTSALGNYARVGVVGSYGVAGDSVARGEWRGDLIARVTLDPFSRHRFGFSLGGGLSWHHRAWLLAMAELEGPSWRGMTVAAQAGVGGGYRAGLVLRRAIAGRR